MFSLLFSPHHHQPPQRERAMTRMTDISGMRFGLYLVIRQAGAKDGNARWLCRCECGRERVVAGHALRRGESRSCGCAQRHGEMKNRSYRVWVAMKGRCLNPTNKDYKYYGARGITVCHRWRTSFLNFLADMGERPEGMSLDRINNDGHYEPSNCRWATAHEQGGNRRCNAYISYNGITLCSAAWARRLGVSNRYVYLRRKQYGGDAIRVILGERNA